jgi:ATP phosphoribosyltransferase
MLGGDSLRVAVPSKGRLHEASLEILRRAGLRFRVSGRRLFAVCSESATRIIFSNVQDIPVLVAEGVVDLGITGSDQIAEKGLELTVHHPLGFGRCRLSLAAHKDAQVRGPRDLSGRVVGSKFVNLARDYFERAGAEDVHILEIQGAVEVMVLLGLVDAIVEIVETGSSLVENDLVEIDEILRAEAVLVGNGRPRDVDARDRLLRRVEGVLVASRYSLLEYNCPAEQIEAASRITPGFSSPTVQELKDPLWLSVKVLVERDRVQSAMDELEKIGCVAILETELRHTRL